MKQILNKFEEDKAFNQQHPHFAPFDDEELGERFVGGFIKDCNSGNRACEEIVFDNGHLYRHFFETAQIETEVIPKAFFIHKYIEKCVYDIIVNNSEDKTPTIRCRPNEVEVIADANPILMFRAVIDRDNIIVSVTNIFVYIQHCGYGKQLLKSIYSFCKKLGYRMLLTEVVLPFYQSMVDRGATIVESGNIVEITDKTNLD